MVLRLQLLGSQLWSANGTLPKFQSRPGKKSSTEKWNLKSKQSYLPGASSCMETETGGLSVSLWGANWGEGERCPSMVGWVGPVLCWVGGATGGGGGGKGGGTSSRCSSSSPTGPWPCSKLFRGTWEGLELWLLTGESDAKATPRDPGWTPWNLPRGGGVPSGQLNFSRWGKRTEPLFLERDDGSPRGPTSENGRAGLWWPCGGSEVSRSLVKAGGSGFSLHTSSLCSFAFNLKKKREKREMKYSVQHCILLKMLLSKGQTLNVFVLFGAQSLTVPSVNR